MNANPLKISGTFDQSIWLDYIRCDLISSGELRRLIEGNGLRGMTSNPSIFENAIVDSDEYDDHSQTMAYEGKGVSGISETLSRQDVQGAADEFRSVSDGTDGQVNPHLAHDANHTVDEAGPPRRRIRLRTGHNREEMVTPHAELPPPNHDLTVVIAILFQHRTKWMALTAVGLFHLTDWSHYDECS